MRIPRIAASALAALALAAGSVVGVAGTASATYSDCLDYTAQAGGDPRGTNQVIGCRDGAANKPQRCREEYVHPNGPDRWAPTGEQVEAACTAAAVPYRSS